MRHVPFVACFFLVGAFFGFGSIALFVGARGSGGVAPRVVQPAAKEYKRSELAFETAKRSDTEDSAARARLSRGFVPRAEKKGDAVVVVWCPSCAKLEDGLRNRGYEVYHDVIARGDFSRIFGEGINNNDAPLPVLRMRIKPSKSADADPQQVCNVAGALIQSERKAGGCVIQNETEEYKPRGLVMQWLEGKYGG